MNRKKRTRPRGRPPTGNAMDQITVRVPPQMLEAIDSIIAGRLDRPDRSSVIRELVAEALQARARKGRQ